MKVGNNIRLQILNPDFSVKYGLKLIISRIRTKNCWSTIDQALHWA